MPPKIGKPATGTNRDGPSDFVSRQGRPNNSRTRSTAQLTFRVPPDGAPVTVTGREAQTLALLIATAPRGFTSGEASPLGWARRTSHYVFRLRRLGVQIITTPEEAGDARVGRYALVGPLVVVPPEGESGQ